MTRFSSLRLLVTVCAALAVAGAVAGCGTSETSQVREKVDQFATAANRHDYATICTSVLGPRLLADIAAGGVSCQKAMQLALGRVRGAYLKLGTITIDGASRASALAATQATGEKTSIVTLELAKESTGWRIVSLGQPAGA